MPKFEAIGLTCADLAKTTHFYGLLGLGAPASSGDHLDLELANGVRLRLFSVALIKKLNPEWSKPTGHAFGLVFRCISPDEVDKTFYEVAHAGFPTASPAPYDAPWGQRYATLLDPDGNHIDLYADLPSRRP